MNRRVVITGMGIWSCLGTSIEQVAESLKAGKSGIGVEEKRLEYGYRSPLTGIVPKPELKGLIDRHLRRGLSEEAEYAYMASLQAFKMAGVSQEWLDANECGCIFGNDSSAKPVIEAHEILLEKHDTELLGQSYLFQAMNSTVTMNLSTIFRLKGVNFTISAACASGSHSVGLAYMMIRSGLQNMVLCGGAQETNYYSMASFDAIGAFSKNTANPRGASRPFDKNRDGLVPSGGGAALVLEDYDHAVARGANIIAEVLGYGFSSNGTSVISQPSDETCDGRRRSEGRRNRLHQCTRHRHTSGGCFRSYGYRQDFPRRARPGEQHQEYDRTRMLDGGGKRTCLFSHYDEQRFCRPEHQP